MKPASLLLPAALLILLAFPGQTRALWIINVNLIDGTGRPVIRNTSIRIRGDRIAEISSSPAPGKEEVLDARGAYALPGLIDSHTHLQSAPGTVYRKDSEAMRACLSEYHLHGNLASGVTSVLDNAAGYPFTKKLKAYFEAGGVGPRTFFLAPFLTPPGGYVSDAKIRKGTFTGLWSPVKSRDEVIAHLEKGRELEPVGVKVAIEDGFGPIAVYDLHSAEMREAIREEAARRGMPLYIHSMSNEAHRIALSMKPRVLVHSLFKNETPDPEVIMAMKKSGVFVISTIAVFDFLLTQWRLSDLDTPLVQLTVPPIEIETARNPLAWKFQNEELVSANSPGWAPGFILKLAEWMYLGRDGAQERLTSAMKNLKLLYDAGVPIVMGSDSGNWPIIVSYFHGPGAIREMELLVQAGIPPLETIRAATQRAARMIGMERDLGTLEAGKFADLLIVKSNPLQDMRALRKLDWVIKGGEAKRPREWMALASQCGGGL